ncbi:MAG: efflux RND transporter periplasmic adaptor subunit [Acidobacteria bacterium]|nr:efflux RND transporter periplasmic adaptor subunit [Acidobacteriota bacterium]
MFRTLLTFSLLVLCSCSGPYSNPTVKATTDRPPVVRVQRAEMLSIPEVVAATGELLAEEQAMLRAKVAGRVVKMNVDLGSRVEAGEIVAELEKDDYELRLKQSEAAVEQSRARLGLGPNDGDKIDPAKTAIVRQAAASLKEASLMYGNATELFKRGIVSNVDYQRAGVNLQGAEARHQGAIEEVYRTQAEILQKRHEIALARQQLTDTVIRAPFRGAVTQRIAGMGEYLAVNAPAALLVRWHPLRVRLQVPERQAFKVKAGQRIHLTMEGNPAPKPGRVVRLSPAMDAQNRSLVVEGEIPNESGILRAGAFIEASITVNADARGISIPSKSVLNFAGVDRVFIEAGGVLAERIVRIGRHLDGGMVEVVQGLEAGSRFVLDPSDRFTPGMKVVVEGSR